MGGAVYRALFGTRLFSTEIAASRHYVALPATWAGDAPAALSAADALSAAYGAAFVYYAAPMPSETPEQVQTLLRDIDERAEGRRCFLWGAHGMEFAGEDGEFFTTADFGVELTEGVIVSFPNNARFVWDERARLLRFDNNAGFRFSNYHYGDNPFSGIELCPATGKLSFSFTVLAGWYFAAVFRVGFVYGHGEGESLAFQPIEEYQQESFDLSVTLDFADVKSSTMHLPEGASFTTRFITVYGENVLFTAGRGAGFGFASRPYPLAEAQLALIGAFYPGTPCGTHERGILCGALGTEYFQLPKGQPITFALGKGHGAYAPKYPAAALSIDDFVHPADALPLSDAHTTSWATLPGGTLYFSQPAENPYYEGAGSLLDPAQLYTRLEEDTPYFPLVPSCGPEYAGYAGTVVAPARAAILADGRAKRRVVHAHACETNGTHTLAAPSGYLLELRGEAVDAILLTEEMRLEDPSPQLVSAFNTSGMLLVAADRAALPFDFRVPLSGWDLRFPAGESILIVKSMKGKLYDERDKARSLLGNVSVWTAKDTFSTSNPAGVSRDLMIFLEKALADRANSAYYAPLIEAVTREDWRGCILIDTPLDESAFPRELRAVFPRGGTVSMQYFLARQTDLTPGKDGPGFAGDAGYSGFAAYAAPGYTGGSGPAQKADEYAFCQLEIKAFFDKGALAHFGSVSQLVFPRIAGVKTESGAALLRGGYVARDGKPAFALQAEAGNALRFARGAPLWGFSLGDVALESAAGADRFTIGGSLLFPVPEGGDILSYDRLFFSGYVLTQAGGAFREDLSALSFDSVGSAAREGSLARALGLVPEKIVSGGQGFAGLGFAPCRGRLRDVVGGLQYRAALGTAGSLSPGRFITVGILIGWDAQGRLALGMRLPEALPLEGVLQMTTGGARLAYAPESGFSVHLADIALSALGLLKLPPNGTISMTVQEGSWFAAYKATPHKSERMPARIFLRPTSSLGSGRSCRLRFLTAPCRAQKSLALAPPLGCAVLPIRKSDKMTKGGR